MELIFSTPQSYGIYKIEELPFIDIKSELKIPNLSSTDFTLADFNGDLRLDIFLSKMNTVAKQNFDESYKHDTLLINKKRAA